MMVQSQSGNCESHQSNFNVHVQDNNLEAGNYSTSRSDDNCEREEYTPQPKLTRNNLSDKQREMLNKF